MLTCFCAKVKGAFSVFPNCDFPLLAGPLGALLSFPGIPTILVTNTNSGAKLTPLQSVNFK